MGAREQFGADDFTRIGDFNTPETISILGTAASDISEMVLREIASTVIDLRRQKIRLRDRDAEAPDTGRKGTVQAQKSASGTAPQKEAEAEVWLYEENERPPWGVEAGSHSPWGKVQTCREIADGVFEISTARHGGITLRESDAEGVFSPEIIARAGKEYGWLYFEEDEEAPIAAQQLQDRGLLRGTDQQWLEIHARDSVANQKKTPYAREPESRKTICKIAISQTGRFYSCLSLHSTKMRDKKEDNTSCHTAM